MFVKDNTHPPARTSKNDSKQAEFQSALNISDFPHRGLQVEVVLMNPNGNVTVRIYEARKTKKLVNELPKETGRQPQTIFSNTKK